MALDRTFRIDETTEGREPPGGRLDLSELVGTWVNTDRGSSGGTLRYELSQRDGQLLVRGFGAGDPEGDGQGEAFEWGEAEATPLAQTVTETRAWAFNCRFDFGFSSTEIAAYTKEGILIAASFNQFSDGSDRADYWTREFFYRERGA
jgi:hypothetical protein